MGGAPTLLTSPPPPPWAWIPGSSAAPEQEASFGCGREPCDPIPPYTTGHFRLGQPGPQAEQGGWVRGALRVLRLGWASCRPLPGAQAVGTHCFPICG